MKYYLIRLRQYAVTGVLVLLLLQVVPLLYQAMVFPSDLDTYAMNAAGVRMNEYKIRSFILQDIDSRGLKSEPGEILVEIQPAKRTIILDVTYHAPIDLLVTEYVLDFHTHSNQQDLHTPQQAKETVLP